MKNLVWFVLGLAGGFVLAHFVNKDPRGREVLADIDARIAEFTDRISAAYHEQEARFSDGAEAATDAAAEAATDAAAEAVAAASGSAASGDTDAAPKPAA